MQNEDKPTQPTQPNNEQLKEKDQLYTKELAEKTLNESNLLANQTFAASPFSQNFDPWLTKLKQIISDFESTTLIKVDDQFLNERSQIFQNIENTFKQKKAEEENIGAVAKALADHNYLLAETDKEYAEKARELSLKRDNEVNELTNRINALEHEMQTQEQGNGRRKILKKKTDDKIPQITQELKSSRSMLELAQLNFNTEQDRLHEDYEKKKQDIVGQVESLRTELKELQTDTTQQARQAACKAIADAVNSQIQRNTIIA